MNTPKIFIDGEHGTTGLQIRERLDARGDVRLISLDPALRKDEGARAEMMAEADLAILCLPDDAAKEAAAMAASLGAATPKLIDASTAHRVSPDWAYGFPELNAAQGALIAGSARVSNPGCYPTGAIALLRPLIDAGLLPPDYPVAINAVSGYSGGGKAMIAQFEGPDHPAFELYGLDMRHKHVPETQLYAGLTRRPIFVPSVAAYAQGMLVSIPLFLSDLSGAQSPEDLRGVLAAHYAGARCVKVLPPEPARLEPEALNGTNDLELRVYGDPHAGQAVLIARLDNLGKGASGAAVQNMELMLNLSRP
jgi:N-acetyl-gamma-glutamyl-phosphate reductase